MPLSAGDKLDPHEIVSPIGAGGMGEVGKARDPRSTARLLSKLEAIFGAPDGHLLHEVLKLRLPAKPGRVVSLIVNHLS